MVAIHIPKASEGHPTAASAVAAVAIGGVVLAIATTILALVSHWMTATHKRVDEINSNYFSTHDKITKMLEGLAQARNEAREEAEIQRREVEELRRTLEELRHKLEGGFAERDAVIYPITTQVDYLLRTVTAIITRLNTVHPQSSPMPRRFPHPSASPVHHLIV